MGLLTCCTPARTSDRVRADPVDDDDAHPDPGGPRTALSVRVLSRGTSLTVRDPAIRTGCARWSTRSEPGTRRVFARGADQALRAIRIEGHPGDTAERGRHRRPDPRPAPSAGTTGQMGPYSAALAVQEPCGWPPGPKASWRQVGQLLRRRRPRHPA
ncbi:hypothetical protein HBB16_13805 [Pseudonocardia sp. MCCB 268]|nr:hypothetical protein [Pseudonocardia cytotoxica]